MDIAAYSDCDLCEGTGSIVLNGMIGGCYKCQQRELKDLRDKRTQTEDIEEELDA